MTGERASLSVTQLDRLPSSEAERLLTSCCGSRAWVRGMLGRRPFGNVDSMLRAAEEVWWSLDPADWREAFDHHPRIGERAAAVAQDGRAQAWSAGEQRGIADADATVRAALAEGNREYERRFGYIYLVSAAGKSADELLAILRGRLSNDAETELRVAAGEQAKITRLRLLKLVDANTNGTGGGGRAAETGRPKQSLRPPPPAPRSR